MDRQTEGLPADGRLWMARATGYELASQAFGEPRGETAAALCNGSFAQACIEVAEALSLAGYNRLPQPDGGVAAELGTYRGADPDAVFHRLRREHTRLFTGTGEPLVTPYAGVHWAQERGIPGMLFVGTETVAIEHLMRACGAAHAPGTPNVPLDHMGTLCEFASYMCLARAGAVAVPAGCTVDGRTYRTFVDDHLAPFARWFCAQVDALSSEGLLRLAARMLGALVEG